jgi:hypothetical protein
MKEDPDAEVYRWTWITLDRLFSKEVWGNLHVPPKDNVVMKGLGFSGVAQTEETQDHFQKSAAAVKSKNPVQAMKDKYSRYLQSHGGEHSGYDYLQRGVREMKDKYRDYIKDSVKVGFQKVGMKMTVDLKAPKHPDSWYPKDQVAKGHIVEKEHSDNPKVKDIITKNHLDEEGQTTDYYNDALFKRDLEKKVFWKGFFKR